jgi:hypothetical protein
MLADLLLMLADLLLRAAAAHMSLGNEKLGGMQDTGGVAH